MRILVVTPTYLPIRGGAELLIYEVYRRLAARHTVQILTPSPPTRQARAFGVDLGEKEPDPPVLRFRDRLSLFALPGHHLTRGLIPPFSLSAISNVKTAASQFHPHVIHAWYAVSTGLAAVLAQRSVRSPLLVSFVGRDVPGPGTPWGWKYYDRLIAGRAQAVTYISDYCRTALFGSRPNLSGRTIYAGVDLERFCPGLDGRQIREELGIGPEAPVLFALQRLSREKRVDVLIDSMVHILRGEPTTILVIGGKGPEATRLQQLATELGVAGQVRFAGFIPDERLPRFHAMADIFVLHSTYETFGIALAEAMAAGKPVLSVKSTAIAEVVQHGVNGLLVPPQDPIALARAAIGLIRNKEQRIRLATNARQKAVSCFGWDRIALQYEEVLRTIATEPSRHAEEDLLNLEH